MSLAAIVMAPVGAGQKTREVHRPGGDRSGWNWPEKPIMSWGGQALNDTLKINIWAGPSQAGKFEIRLSGQDSGISSKCTSGRAGPRTIFEKSDGSGGPLAQDIIDSRPVGARRPERA